MSNGSNKPCVVPEYALKGPQVDPQASYWMYCSKLHIVTIEELTAVTDTKGPEGYFPPYPDPCDSAGAETIQREMDELVELSKHRNDPCALSGPAQGALGLRRPISKLLNLTPPPLGAVVVNRFPGEQIIRTGRGMARAVESETPGLFHRHALNYLINTRHWSPPPDRAPRTPHRVRKAAQHLSARPVRSPGRTQPGLQPVSRWPKARHALGHPAAPGLPVRPQHLLGRGRRTAQVFLRRPGRLPRRAAVQWDRAAAAGGHDRRRVGQHGRQHRAGADVGGDSLAQRSRGRDEVGPRGRPARHPATGGHGDRSVSARTGGHPRPVRLHAGAGLRHGQNAAEA